MVAYFTSRQQFRCYRSKFTRAEHDYSTLGFSSMSSNLVRATSWEPMLLIVEPIECYPVSPKQVKAQV